MRWASMLEEASFFFKLRHISRFYRQFSKKMAREFRQDELDTRANLEVAMTTLHDDVNNFEKQGEVTRLHKTINEVERKRLEGQL